MYTSKMWWMDCSEGSLENTPRLGPWLLEVPYSQSVEATAAVVIQYIKVN